MGYRAWTWGIDDLLSDSLNVAKCNRAALSVTLVPDRASGKPRVRGEYHWVTEAAT